MSVFHNEYALIRCIEKSTLCKSLICGTDKSPPSICNLPYPIFGAFLNPQAVSRGRVCKPRHSGSTIRRESEIVTGEPDKRFAGPPQGEAQHPCHWAGLIAQRGGRCTGVHYYVERKNSLASVSKSCLLGKGSDQFRMTRFEKAEIEYLLFRGRHLACAPW